MKAESLSALVFRSPDPARLAAFYREHLGIPFEEHAHGPIRGHQEAWFEGVHLAVLPSATAEHALAPTFRVRDLDAWIAHLATSDLVPTHAPIVLDDDMRVVSFRDVDGNVFRLIDVGARADTIDGRS